jgi:hypothetical protein
MPGCQYYVSQAFSSCFDTSCHLILDLVCQVTRRGQRTLEDTCISVFPNHPGDEQCHRPQRFAQLFWCSLFRHVPPVEECVLSCWWGASHAKSGQYVVPDLSSEGAADSEVLNCLRHLIA